MEVAHKGKATGILKQVPTPPPYLDARGKRQWKRIGLILIANHQLKRIHLPALEILAVEYSQYEWAIKEINKKNRQKAGSGYIQKFSTGAQNISVEVTLKNKAIDNIMDCIKRFGLDPKSEKDLSRSHDPDQMDLLDALGLAKSK